MNDKEYAEYLENCCNLDDEEYNMLWMNYPIKETIADKIFDFEYEVEKKLHAFKKRVKLKYRSIKKKLRKAYKDFKYSYM